MTVFYKQFFIKFFAAGLVLVLLFLGVVSYLHGSLFNSTNRVHRFKIIAADYDNGIVAQSFNAAYSQLKGDSFPTLEFVDPAQYTPEDLQQKVKRDEYWAAIYTNTNASQRLVEALVNNGSIGGAAAGAGAASVQPYNASQAITYVWKEVRYAAFVDGYISSNLQILVQASRLAFNQLFGPANISVNFTQPGSVQTLLNPIQATEIDLKSMKFGARIFYNTVTVAMVILQQFFFVLAGNGISLATGFYLHKPWWSGYLIRLGFIVVLSLLSALSSCGYYWAFGEGWDLNGGQFMLTWMILWLWMGINHLLLFTISCLVPLPVMPIILMPWIFLNVTSTASPFQLNPYFYYWGYALPSYNAFSLLFDVWGGSSSTSTSRNIGLLFVWLVIAAAPSVFAYSVMARKAWAQQDKLKQEQEEIIHREVTREMTREMEQRDMKSHQF